MPRQVYALAAGQDVTIAIDYGIRLTIIPGAGSTVTYSRVDGPDADEHTAETTDVLAADGPTAITPDWPYYHVSVVGGTARVAVT